MADADSTQISATPTQDTAPAVNTASAVPPATGTESTPPSPPPAAEAPAVSTTADASTKETSSLLGAEAEEPKPGSEEAAKTDEKTEEKKPEEAKEEAKAETKEGDKPAEGDVKDATADAAPPTFEAFKLPESFKADDKALSEFTGLLGKLESAKGDHKSVQEVGQQMVDMYIAEVSKATQNMTDYFVSIHNKQVQDEFDALKKDPAIGGGDDNKFQKYQRDLVNFIASHGGSKEEVTAFRKFVDERGVANAKPLVQLLSNLKSKIEGYEKESSNMLPGTKPASSKPVPGKGIMQALYGKK